MSRCISCGNCRPCFCGPPQYEQIEDDRLLHPSTRWARKFLDCRAFPSDVKLLEQYLCQAFNAGARQVVEEIMEITDVWID